MGGSLRAQAGRMNARQIASCISSLRRPRATLAGDSITTGVNPAGDAGDTSPNILVGGGTSTGIFPPIFYVLSDIADQYWLPSVRSASSRFHSAIRRYLPSHTSPHSVVRPPNLELALTPLSITTGRRILTEGRIAGGAPEQNVPSPWGGSAPHLPWLVT